MPRSDLPTTIERLRGGLIVSCQAVPGDAMFGADHMAAFARAALDGGAAGLRANGPDDVAAVHRAAPLPLIGIWKVDLPGYEVRITPRLSDALGVAAAGADIIALDGTLRPHPDGQSAAELIRRVKQQTGLPVMADVATLEEGLAAEAAGADLVGTTLSGYTADSPQQEQPDFALLLALADQLRVPLIAEGRINTPALAAQALALGAFAVTVGSAITRPQLIAAAFVAAMQPKQGAQH